MLVPHPDDDEDEDDDEEYYADRGVDFMTAWGITYPISRKLGLVMSDPMVFADRVGIERVARGELDYRQPGNTQMERFINLSTATSASLSLFHHPDDGGFVPDELPAPDPVTLRMSGGPQEFSGVIVVHEASRCTGIAWMHQLRSAGLWQLLHRKPMVSPQSYVASTTQKLPQSGRLRRNHCARRCRCRQVGSGAFREA